MKRIFGFRSKKRSWRRSQRCVLDLCQSKFHRAACDGDVAEVQRRLLLGKSGLNDRDLNHSSDHHRTALHLACAFGHPEVVTLLLERKCDIDARDSDNNTALIKAIQCYSEECATILLEHGANPNVANARGNTALHYAIYHEKTSIAARLLSRNADTAAKNEDGLTPLLLALRENRMEVAELLKKGRANIDAMDKPERQIFEDEKKRLKNSKTSHREEPDLEVTSKKEQKRRDGCENNQDQVSKNLNLYFWFKFFLELLEILTNSLTATALDLTFALRIQKKNTPEVYSLHAEKFDQKDIQMP
ncbi:uncharacterized protein O8D03_013950 [Erethizon dorsatum]